MKSLSFLNKSIWTTSEISVSFGLLMLRIGISFSMIYLHGYPRLINFSEISSEFADPLGVGIVTSLSLVVFAEFFCSLFLIIGLFTRWSCVPLIITMIVATWIINGGKGFIFQEKSTIYLIGYTSLLISGGGYFSLDYLLLGRKMKTKTQTTTNNV
ncbi:DoxX family protein [Aquimarina macrocephali]|uniref:DoxX family protein n=1 Tax=Aquimarina macrocephali TaxID=666563 RepID=UPI0005552100|nr:DoxX family protein [Aquimarina macrocephali]